MTVRPIVLDAAGTLIEVAGSVGEAYAEDARATGAELDAEAMERGFARAMRAAPPLAFGSLGSAARRTASRAWWRDVARRALVAAGDVPPDFDFEIFFDRVWERFSGPDAWHVFEDVRPGLRSLRARGFPLAVFSNWDVRLEPLLARLGIGGYFCRVIVSSDLPAAKPAPAAFDAVSRILTGLESAGSPVMVGDRIDHDVSPAMAAGWAAVWLDRVGSGEAPPGVRVARDLRELPALLG